MLFNSTPFFIFLAIILPLAWILPRYWKKQLLLLASYIFYGCWDWRFCFLILLSTLIDFVIGRKIANSEAPSVRKKYLYLSLFANLGLLSIFKYYNFFAASFQDFLALFGQEADFVHLHLILPVGISFYTFQTLSYTIDIYRKKLAPAASFTDFALFVAFFPQLVAGPIERAAHLLPQIEKLDNPTRLQLRSGWLMITYGLLMKMVIGDNCGKVVDMVFAQPSDFSSTELMIAPVLFLIQVYGDFAGYSLVARGVARLLGVELMVNFKQPFLATNYTDFWRQWHISLYQWFREYVYFPLGGNRKGKNRTYLNVLIIMTLLGLWHGASWTYILWGFVNGILLIFDKWFRDHVPLRSLGEFTRWLGRLATLLTFSVTLIIFRTYSLTKMKSYLSYLWAGDSFSVDIRIWWTALWAVLLTFSLDWMSDRYGGDAAFLLKINPVTRYAILFAVWLVLLLLLRSVQPAPFVYFQF